MNTHFIILLDDLVQNVSILDLFTCLSVKLRALDTVEREIFTLLRVFEQLLEDLEATLRSSRLALLDGHCTFMHILVC